MTMRWITDDDSTPRDMSITSHCGSYTIVSIPAPAIRDPASMPRGTTFEAWFNSHPPRIVAADCAGLSEAKRMCEQHKTNQR